VQRVSKHSLVYIDMI